MFNYRKEEIAFSNPFWLQEIFVVKGNTTDPQQQQQHEAMRLLLLLLGGESGSFDFLFTCGICIFIIIVVVVYGNVINKTARTHVLHCQLFSVSCYFFFVCYLYIYINRMKTMCLGLNRNRTRQWTMAIAGSPLFKNVLGNRQ